MSKHVRTKFIAATPSGGRRHRKISEEKSKLIESTNYLHWLLALALLHCGVLRGSGACEVRRRRDASPAGADRVDAVIPPDPAVARLEAHDGEIRPRRRRSDKAKYQYANCKNQTFH